MRKNLLRIRQKSVLIMTQTPKTPKNYHQATSYDRYAMEPHAMDWANQPNPYKSYPDFDGIALPEIQDVSKQAFFDQELQVVYDVGRLKSTEKPLELVELSKICLLANGLTARFRQGDSSFYYRSTPSAGALYPNEMYFVSFDTEMLPTGIYHCGVHNRFLTRLRDGNFTKQMQAAVPELPKDCVGVFIVSGIFFRSAWKYRKRAYRYVLLDGGHLAENLRLAISATGYPCGLHHAFDDQKLDALLGVDENREGNICCVSVSGGSALKVSSKSGNDKLPESIMSASRVSSAEIIYPEIIDIHEASKTVLESDSATKSMIENLGISLTGGYVPIPDAGRTPAVLNYPETIFNRRSKRNFIPKPIAHNHLNYLLTLLCRTSDSMISMHPDIASSVTTGFLVGNMKGLDPGFYLLNPVSQKTVRIFNGHMIDKMTSVCLDQAWLKHASVHFVFMSNLEMLDKKWGARGYRYAMLTAGRLGHAVYLGATALGLGACGIGAIYDNEARQLLGLNDASALLYLVAAGRTK
jgi:SagB-type dehydrogenase family enzyme